MINISIKPFEFSILDYKRKLSRLMYSAKLEETFSGSNRKLPPQILED
jgi:hypothetical protein